MKTSTRAALLSCLSIACALPGSALAEGYFGKTTSNTGNLNIAIQSFRSDIPAVGLENRSPVAVRCEATFSNGAQFSERRQTTIDPGKRATLAFRPHTITSIVDIDVQCRPA